MQTPNAPWLSAYGSVPHTLSYPDGSMHDLISAVAEKYPDNTALDFFGLKTTYRALMEAIDDCARALMALGVREGERVTICMPNMPQAVVMFYAVNKAGAVANMVHPLSAEEELIFYLNISGSRIALTMDRFYPKFKHILPKTNLKTLILTDADDGLRGIKKIGYTLSQLGKRTKYKTGGLVLRWRDFIAQGRGYAGQACRSRRGSDEAAILYSGGTSGKTKGISLSNLNFNALALQTAAAGDCITTGHRMLAVLPMFHGFGLGVCIHTTLTQGCAALLVPQFSVDSFIELLKKHRPHYIAGVPTLFEAILRSEKSKTIDFSRLEGIFSGGDTLPVELKRRMDAFLKERGASVQIREGYGLTECVTASCLTPKDFHKEGSIGIPFPDTYYKIVKPGTQETLPYGETGEICLTGPTLMAGYLDAPEETAAALQTHEDGRIWLHTGDLGFMDEEGFVYFRQRIKRVIISSGYTIYPSHIENALLLHPAVSSCCVIGVPDDYKMQKVKAFVVLKEGAAPAEDVKKELLQHCRRHVARYAMPYDIEIRDALPKTLVGKIAYTVLEKEEAERRRA
jgi:long-chain acyl-CoA synthetase